MSMSDSMEPPSKRARLEADAPMFGALLDAPGSPVDDMDDDFYDTTPAEPQARPESDAHSAAATFAAAASAPATFHLPGLGAMGDAPVTLPPPLPAVEARAEAEAPEEGELDDAEAFYHDAANDAPALGEGPQHGELARSEGSAESLAPVVAPAVDADEASDSDDGLFAAITNGLAEEEGKAEFLEAAEANKDDKNAEWQLDSEASSSSSDSSSEGDIPRSRCAA
jgi:H/ACA ribonucleoprotein complex non-core subunit NAF1